MAILGPTYRQEQENANSDELSFFVEIAFNGATDMIRILMKEIAHECKHSAVFRTLASARL